MTGVACSVLVAGGGVAGAFAAIAAARSGVPTILLEREAYLGGIGQAGMFRHICGLYPHGGAIPAETLNAGLTRELVALLDGAVPERVGQVYLQPLQGQTLDRLLTRLCAAEPHLQILRVHTATAVTSEAGQITAVTVTGPEGELTVTPAVTIDGTGDGAVAALAGAAFDLSPPGEGQLAGFTVQLRGLAATAAVLPILVPYHCARGVEQGVLPPLRCFTTFAHGDFPDEGFCKLSVAGENLPGRDEQARADAHTLLAFLAEALPAFREARITAMSPRVLDREGRRIQGEYLLTEEDVLAARKFPDGVVRNAWPIELWDRDRGPIYRYLPAGDYYEIPFRCLQVRSFANLLCAGRCIAVTRQALGSTRAMGTCMALGEQAGHAAAYRAVNGHYPWGHRP